MNFHTYDTTPMVVLKLAQLLQESAAQHPDGFYVALGAPTSAVHLYKVLAQEPVKSAVNWSSWHLFLAFDYTDPSSGSVYETAKRELADKVGIPSEQIHPIMTGASPEEEAQRYNALVRDRVPQLGGFPRFHVALLEVAPDGGLAGVFPGQYDLFDTTEVYTVSKDPLGEQTPRVTLSLSALEESKQIVFLNIGPEARFAIGTMINLLPEAKAYPANFLSAKCPWTHLFADPEAMREKSYSIY